VLFHLFHLFPTIYAMHYQIKYHVTVPYLHQSNGTVEEYNRIFLNALRVMISELRYDRKKWRDLISQVEFF
jgi:hypothetical protein